MYGNTLFLTSPGFVYRQDGANELSGLRNVTALGSLLWCEDSVKRIFRMIFLQKRFCKRVFDEICKANRRPCTPIALLFDLTCHFCPYYQHFIQYLEENGSD
ncbi:hypothetical protein D6853_14365 [Butyrivibrio sp. X503]|nr:hypothetical protein D6853_14365 [Butyrivibrio sp. X503]